MRKKEKALMSKKSQIFVCAVAAEERARGIFRTHFYAAKNGIPRFRLVAGSTLAQHLIEGWRLRMTMVVVVAQQCFLGTWGGVAN